MRPRPLIAIVGRPNVGKSTLFNRLAGAPLAIVDDRPGVTRDRHYADADLLGRAVTLVDTGGFDKRDADPIAGGVRRHVEAALGEADVVLYVVDGRAELIAADHEVADIVRRAGRPAICAANKADNAAYAALAGDAYRLGVDRVFPVSSLHGRGIGDLVDALVEALPPPVEEPEPDPDVARVAVVGRPNAGKSSLLNRLAGEERFLVDDRAGTTRDSVDTLVTRADRRYLLIDTAGIRRRSAIDTLLERVAVMRAVRAVERADVVVVLIDAAIGVAEQDARILGLAVERGRAVVLALNKADLLAGDDAWRTAERAAREKLAFAPWAPLKFVSARTGRGVAALFGEIDKVRAQHLQRVPTGALNRFFAEAMERRPAPAYRGHPVRIFVATQSQVAPPAFVLHVNYPEGIHFSYERYLHNQIRERYGFEGTPLRMHFHKRTH